MKIYPAIDIKGGNVVRLSQGNFDKVTKYDEKPYQAAINFQSKGSEFIHVVDLDGAKMGASFNNRVIEEIVENVNIPIQVGGGIRNLKDIENKFEIGVSRVILGTSAIKNIEIIKEAVLRYGDKIAVGVDALNGMVAISGWEEISNKTAVDLVLELKQIGVKTIIYTDISKDGMLSGPNIESTKEIVDLGNIDVIASGGISSLNDLVKVNKIGCVGAIIGKALYSGLINLEDAIKEFKE